MILDDDRSVSLQIRRGDFAHHPNSSVVHGLMPMEYYEEALNVVAKKVKKPRIYVISDDTEWCEANLDFAHPTKIVEHVPDKGYEDMRLMSLCRHHIIANSSFGWWAAWLCPNPDKIIVAPARWLIDTSRDTTDLIPSSWLRI